MDRRAPSVRNTAPASKQVTAEQLLREAYEQREKAPTVAQGTIADIAELHEYQARKREEFETSVRMHPHNIAMWLKYATWEATQKEFERSRSVFERIIDIDYRNHGVWIKYAEMEMKAKFINRARNIWNRAVSLLPRVDQFWLKYSLMEEQLHDVSKAREVFERWMKWAPDDRAWDAYLKLELRLHNMERCRDILERLLACHPKVSSYLKYVRFEEKHGTVPRARKVLERASSELGDYAVTVEYYIAFAKFEERHREIERAEAIYNFGLAQLKQRAMEFPDDELTVKHAADLYSRYSTFQKRHGDSSKMEEVVFDKKRLDYQNQLEADPTQYDTWHDYIRFEMTDCTSSSFTTIRHIFEKAIAPVPLSSEKEDWKRYVYIWIKYALFEERHTKDIDRTRQVYRACLDVIPHTIFTFAKVWIYFAEFEIRELHLDAARQILGTAIGQCPKHKLFQYYTDLEFKLGDLSRCRTIYEKHLAFEPENSTTWARFAKMECDAGELDRSRGIYELGLQQATLESPEVLWKAYIDFESRLGSRRAVCELYERLLGQTQHVKVWARYAQFLAESKQLDDSRSIFKRAYNWFKSTDAMEELMVVVETWSDFEKAFGTPETLAALDAIRPHLVTKKRPLHTADGSQSGFEQVEEYELPQQQPSVNHAKLLSAAKSWKKARNN